MSNITRVMNGYEDALEAANYAEALVLDEEEISDGDYRFVWTDAYNGDYPPKN